jgi:hypothetical protein
MRELAHEMYVDVAARRRRRRRIRFDVWYAAKRVELKQEYFSKQKALEEVSLVERQLFATSDTSSVRHDADEPSVKRDLERDLRRKRDLLWPTMT